MHGRRVGWWGRGFARGVAIAAWIATVWVGGLEARERFVGAFRLVSYVTYDEAGDPTTTPYTEGVIMYDDSGRMGVHLMDPAHQGREDRGYIAYFGAYEVDEEQGVVRHLIEGSLGGGAGRRTAIRHYRFEDDGNTLILEVRNAGRVAGTVRWERYR